MFLPSSPQAGAPLATVGRPPLEAAAKPEVTVNVASAPPMRAQQVDVSRATSADVHRPLRVYRRRLGHWSQRRCGKTFPAKSPNNQLDGNHTLRTSSPKLSPLVNWSHG